MTPDRYNERQRSSSMLKHKQGWGRIQAGLSKAPFLPGNRSWTHGFSWYAHRPMQLSGLGILPSTLRLLSSFCMELALGSKSIRWGKCRVGTSQQADESSDHLTPISHVLTPAQRCSRNKPRVCLFLPPPSFFTLSSATSSIFISMTKANSSTNWMSWTRRRLCAHELLQQARDTEDTELHFPSSTSGASKLPAALVLGTLISSSGLCRHPRTSDTHS